MCDQLFTQDHLLFIIQAGTFNKSLFSKEKQNVTIAVT